MTTVDDILAHHGVKGMKWGVRKDRGHEGEQATTKKIAKLDSKYAKQNPQKLYISIHNRAAQLTNQHDISRINNKPEYKGKDFSKDTPLRRKYYKEHMAAFEKRANEAAKELGTNASGTMRIAVDGDGNGNWTPVLVPIKHNDEMAGILIRVTYDAAGHITKITPEDNSAAHAEELTDLGVDFLAHYGVLGMKWGQHLKAHGVKSTTKTAAAKAQAHVKKDIAERTDTNTHVRAKVGQHVQVVGGNKRTAHEDAIRARTAEQIAKKNTLDALSNADLKKLVERMNLESQYRNLAVNETRATRGEKFATDLITKHSGKVDTALAVGLGPLAPLGKHVVEGAITNATANKGMSGGKVKEKNKH